MLVLPTFLLPWLSHAFSSNLSRAYGRLVSLSRRVVEVVVGSVKERIEAEFRLVEVEEGLRGREQVREEGLAVVLKGMRRFLGLVVQVEAQEEKPSECWACVP
jgi:hypothetical protein